MTLVLSGSGKELTEAASKPKAWQGCSGAGTSSAGAGTVAAGAETTTAGAGTAVGVAAAAGAGTGAGTAAGGPGGGPVAEGDEWGRDFLGSAWVGQSVEGVEGVDDLLLLTGPGPVAEGEELRLGGGRVGSGLGVSLSPPASPVRAPASPVRAVLGGGGAEAAGEHALLAGLGWWSKAAPGSSGAARRGEAEAPAEGGLGILPVSGWWVAGKAQVGGKW